MKTATVLIALFALSVCGCTPPGIEGPCIDLWSIVHFGTGMLLSGALDLGRALAALGGYELVEPYFWPGFSEPLSNQGCDIVIGAAGWLIGS